MAITITNDGCYLQAVKGDEDGNVAISLGATGSEGLQYVTLEETVDLAAAGAKFVALTSEIPAGAVIESVSANIEELAVAGGTSAKVGIGASAVDPDKYGLTASLLKNIKVGTILVDAVLGAALQLDVCACTAAGALGDSNFTAGKVRVRIVYKQIVALADAE